MIQMCIRDRTYILVVCSVPLSLSCKYFSNRRDHIRNQEIRSDLDVFRVNERIKEYIRKWIQHINVMKESRMNTEGGERLQF